MASKGVAPQCVAQGVGRLEVARIVGVLNIRRPLGGRSLSPPLVRGSGSKRCLSNVADLQTLATPMCALVVFSARAVGCVASQCASQKAFLRAIMYLRCQSCPRTILWMI